MRRQRERNSHRSCPHLCRTEEAGQTGPRLRTRSEALAATLPPLLADASLLASTVVLGSHGRRRAGMGDEFWQYRPMGLGDEARQIDWRRSARSDQHFIKEKEWQAAQSVLIWVDDSQSMTFFGRQEPRHQIR